MPFAESAAAATARSHSTPAGACSPPAFDLELPPSAADPGQGLRLAEAVRALWAATLALMTAFMQVNAPAHRYLLARRIARNLDTLAGQDCFEPACRERFAKLARRWAGRAQEYAPHPTPARARLRDLLY